VTVRIAFCGNDPWSVPALEAIDGDPALAIELVITNPPKPAGRGGKPRPTAVAAHAKTRDLPLREVDGVRSGEGARALETVRPDVLVVVAYGELLSRATLAVPVYGAINLHFSLLPRWRGAAPVQRALMAGDAETGVSVMQMDEGLDTGPVLNQLEEAIRPEDDAGTLGARLAHLGGRLLVGVLRVLPDGRLPPRPQDERFATLAPRIGSSDRAIDWRRDPEEIARQVRALAPEPGASTTFRGETLKIVQAAPDHEGAAGAPGQVLSADDRGVLVGAGRGAIRLVQVAPAGRKRMDAGAWARGARFTPTEQLG
jgi:methionyl-tRNA formyltransferase